MPSSYQGSVWLDLAWHSLARPGWVGLWYGLVCYGKLRLNPAWAELGNKVDHINIERTLEYLFSQFLPMSAPVSLTKTSSSIKGGSGISYNRHEKSGES